MRSLPLALSHPIGCSCRWIVTISGTVHRLSQNNRVDADDHLHERRSRGIQGAWSSGENSPRQTRPFNGGIEEDFYLLIVQYQ